MEERVVQPKVLELRDLFEKSRDGGLCFIILMHVAYKRSPLQLLPTQLPPTTIIHCLYLA